MASAAIRWRDRRYRTGGRRGLTTSTTCSSSTPTRTRPADRQPERPVLSTVDDTPPGIIDTEYAAIDGTQVTPAMEDVALLEHTRTIDSVSNELGVFTDDTRPTDIECDAVIQQAAQTILGQLPMYVSASLYPRIKQAITYQAAINVELGFYRDQPSTNLYQTILTGLMTGLFNLVGGGATSTNASSVDTVVQRSTMTEYDPWVSAATAAGHARPRLRAQGVLMARRLSGRDLIETVGFDKMDADLAGIIDRAENLSRRSARKSGCWNRPNARFSGRGAASTFAPARCVRR